MIQGHLPVPLPVPEMLPLEEHCQPADTTQAVSAEQDSCRNLQRRNGIWPGEQD